MGRSSGPLSARTRRVTAAFNWQRSGRLDRLLQRLAQDLRDGGKIDLSEAFVNATFASAKRGR
jgi:hypothetical protein